MAVEPCSLATCCPAFYLLDRFHRQLGRRDVVRQRVLVDVQRGQPERHLRLQFGREALLRHIVAALHVQVVEGAEVALRQLRGGDRHEGHAEQAAQLVRTGPRGYLHVGTGRRRTDGLNTCSWDCASAHEMRWDGNVMLDSVRACVT